MKQIVLYTLGILLFSTALAPAQGKFTNLGPQISAAVIQGSEFMREASGRDVVYTVERGSPGHLLGYDVASGDKILDAPLDKTDGAWEVAAASDGTLYTASGNGHLFCHRAGSQQVDDLGDVLNQRVIWDVTPGPDGSVFAGTYPDALVVRYKPGEGFTDVGHGPIVAGENYARSLVYDAATGKIYVGIGSHAHLIELDPKTGEKKELLKEKTAGQEAVYSLQIIPDEKSGARLLAWITNRGKTLVYNLRTQKVEREIPSADVKAAKKLPTSEEVFYYDGFSLRAFNLDHPEQPPREIVRCGVINASQWVDSTHLMLLTRLGMLVNCDTTTGEITQKKLRLPSQPIAIESIDLGPDGKMWMGGFLAGGTASLDPASGKTTTYRGMSQIERIGLLGGEMYFGVYPHGRFYRFDPSKPWGENNPRKFGQIAGQSRPMAMLGVPQLQKVFIGTVPEYGLLGGHLIEYSPATNRLIDHGEVMKHQSIVSLIFAEAEVIGGTSTAGGLGIAPAEKEAKLFGWDPVKAKTVFELAPVPGAIAITCLMHGPDGNVWGVADGTLFVFDPHTQRIVRTRRLVDVNYDTKFIWRDAFLIIHPSGQIYGLINGKFFRLDPSTLHVTILREHGLELLAMDRNGQLYFHQAADLWRYTP